VKYRLVANPGKPRVPLRSTAEMAREFKISTQRLAAMLREDHKAPRHELENANGRWFDPRVLRKWFYRKEVLMSPYQKRVEEEKDQLDDRLYNLDKFIESNDQFKSLLPAEKSRLVAQREVMRDYSRILSERIAAFLS
jgi:hypothetical protein